MKRKAHLISPAEKRFGLFVFTCHGSGFCCTSCGWTEFWCAIIWPGYGAQAGITLGVGATYSGNQNFFPSNTSVGTFGDFGPKGYSVDVGVEYGETIIKRDIWGWGIGAARGAQICMVTNNSCD